MAHFPPDELEALLVLRARQRRAITYAEVFQWFGIPFQRFQVGQLSAALTEVDQRQRGMNRPELAVLVVRQSDGLPGQGWWVEKNAGQWQGAITGPEARAYVSAIQHRCFDWWEAQGD